jgi:hypothetical protein
MKSLRDIIDLFGGMKKLQEAAIRVEVSPYLPLSIEYVGYGPRGGALIAVAHRYVLNGDLMNDPEIVFEITSAEPRRAHPLAQLEGDHPLIHLEGEWTPITYEQHDLGLYQEAIFLDGDKVMVRPKLLKDLQSFVRMWDQNLKEQGFVEAARRQLGG